MGRPLWETRWWTISTESQERLQEAIAQAANGQSVRYEVEVLGARETVAILDLSLKPMRDETGKVILVILQGRDLTDYKQTEKALQQAKEKLTNSVNELEQRNHEIALLAEMSELLQACLTVEEAYKMLAQLVQPLFPEVSGGVFVINDSKNLVDAVATWGESALMSEKRFTPDECWAMRRGRSHFVESLHSNLRCKHVQADSSNAESLCVPMMLQGEALGVLYLSSPHKGRLTEAKQQLSVTIAEHLALALANFKLQEGLQNKPS
jgi:transcriptional regulator with GAF, ATPase, and Fis domain